VVENFDLKKLTGSGEIAGDFDVGLGWSRITVKTSHSEGRIASSAADAALGRRHGWSHRRIARELGINRETIGKHLRLVKSKPAISTPGSTAGRQSLCQPHLPQIASATQIPSPFSGMPFAFKRGVRWSMKNYRISRSCMGSSFLCLEVLAILATASISITCFGGNGVYYYSGSQWSNYPGRFYRLRSP
jgi:hypothetical protein